MPLGIEPPHQAAARELERIQGAVHAADVHPPARDRRRWAHPAPGSEPPPDRTPGRIHGPDLPVAPA